MTKLPLTFRQILSLATAALVLTALAVHPATVLAQTPSYDPHADSVKTSSGIAQTPNNAVGSPDDKYVSLVGVTNFITLDMGAGEEGTGNLRVHVGPLQAQVLARVEFLDSSEKLITREDKTLNVSLGQSTVDFPFSYAAQSKAYRYVRIYGGAAAGFTLDAVEARQYVGSTAEIDTDAGGVPDREEQTDGTNPLDADDDKTDGNGGTTPPSDNPNTPPAPSEDEDSDGMPDNWENDNDLDPNNADDAKADPDNDGITNLFEYRKGSDPNSPTEFFLDQNCDCQKGPMNLPLWLWLTGCCILAALLGGALITGIYTTRGRRPVVTQTTRTLD
jgi:hypothetical protein